MRKLRKDRVPDNLEFYYSKYNFASFVAEFVEKLAITMRKLSRGTAWVIVCDNVGSFFINNRENLIIKILPDSDYCKVSFDKTEEYVKVTIDDKEYFFHPQNKYNESRGLPI